MQRLYLRDLKDGDTVDQIFLLADKQLRANRNANLYLLSTLRDRSGQMSGLMWNVTEDSIAHINTGDYVRVRGKVQLYNGGLQMIVTHISGISADQVDPDDYRPETAKNAEPLLARLREILMSIQDPQLRGLMQCFLDDGDLMEALSEAPAGVKAHHAYHGGLLEHVVNMLEVATRIVEFYPAVNSDLLLVGVFLHDFGKTREMSWDPGFAYTDEGQLLGHMVLAIETLNEKLAETRQSGAGAVPEETVLRIKHMILSHHGTYEFGSARLPMTPEAIALHYLDTLDSKIHEFSTAISEDPNAESNWTPFHPRLDRKLFKGSSAD